MGKPLGRPSGYSPEIATEICEAIATGGSLHKICARKVMPSQSMVYRWLQDREEFREQYERARERQADYEADHIVEIADKAKDPNLARIQIDARKWRSSKLVPKKYGDKVQATVSGDPENPLQVALTGLGASVDSKFARLIDGRTEEPPKQPD